MNWIKLGERIAYDGFRKVIQKTFQLPNGKKATFDTIRGGSFVTIAAFTKEKEAILVKQYRPGAEQSLVSFPEGGIENNENPLTTAVRELEEETGYRAKKIIHLRTFQWSYRVDKRICMLALDCELVGAQQLDDTEFIDIITLPLEKFKTLLTNSADESFNNVDAGFLALHYFDNNREEV